MNKQEQQFREYMESARQSGKSETSGLVHEILHRMEPAIAKSIEENVNGKIRELSSIVVSHIEADTRWKEEDRKWKESVTPQIQAVENVQGWGKVTLYIIGMMSAIAGLAVMIVNIFKR